MKIYQELDLDHFEAWSGAVCTLERIREEDKTRELESILEELYPEGMSASELNDLLWFESEGVYGWLGIKTDEELEAENEKRKEAISARTFADFCDCFYGCDGCPLEHMPLPCEESWAQWKEGLNNAGN